ncbi:hypothetical protein CEE39_07950 [bacterium (candidate division B38) B3_B38]|nr:MAG: hypothetical protein CEE39_07950 [bacterium (candidate division B38) B3_B38]
MSCYFRHMNKIFSEAGLEITSSNKKKADQIIHQIVGVSYKKCSDTWSKVKEHIAADSSRAKFIAKLKSKWAEVS